MNLTNKNIKGNHKFITIEEPGRDTRNILIVRKPRCAKGRLTANDVRMYNSEFICADLVAGETSPGKVTVFKDRFADASGRKMSLRGLLTRVVDPCTEEFAKYQKYRNVLIIRETV
jgi:hypothetical protein